MRKAGKSDSERLKAGFRFCIARDPSAQELVRLSRLLGKARSLFKDNEQGAKEFAGNTESSAWAVTARVLLNLDEFITRE